MATSGNVGLQTSGTDLCYTAMWLLGQYNSDIPTLSAADQAMALRLLNWDMKHSQCFNGFLFKTSVAYLFLPSNQIIYTLSSAGDHCTEAYVTANTTAITTGTSMSVPTTGMTTGDTILIPLSNKTYQATTITVVNSTTLTLGATVSESIPSTTRIFTYTSKINKPLRIYGVASRLYDTSSNFFDRPLQPWAFKDWCTLASDKVNTSEPVGSAYIPRRTDGLLFTIGANQDLARLMILVIQKEVEDLTSAVNEPDFPNEWFLALVLRLAYYLSRSLEFDANERMEFWNISETVFHRTLDNDMENAPMILEMKRK
jgi:hypothetical protein